MLEAEGSFPVVPTVSPAGHGTRIEVGGHQARAAEIQIRDAATFIVQLKISQIAVGNVVAVGVGPGSRDAVDGRLHRVRRAANGRLRADTNEISTQTRLQRGLSIMKHVVRHAYPRRNVVVVRYVVDLAIASGVDKRAGRQLLRGHIPVDVIVPQAHAHRDVPLGPLILNEQPEIRRDLFAVFQRRRPLHQRDRGGAVEIEVHIGVDFPGDVAPLMHEKQPGLERVSSRHERHRCPAVVVVAPVEPISGGRRTIGEISRGIEDGGLVGGDVRLPIRVKVVGGQREASLEQEPRSDRVTPGGLNQVLGPMAVMRLCFW